MMRLHRPSRSNSSQSERAGPPGYAPLRVRKNRGLAHLRLVWPRAVRLAAAIVVGVALGTASRVGDTLAAPVEAIANAGGPWLIAAFAIGAFASRVVDAAALGAATLSCATASYYGYIGVVLDDGAQEHLMSLALFWAVVAIGAGALFGTLGWAWRSASLRVRAAAVGFLTGALVGESVTLAARSAYGSWTWLASAAELATGLAAPWVLLRSKQLFAAATGLGVLAPTGMMVTATLEELARWAAR